MVKGDVEELEHFSIHQSGQSLLYSMLQNNEFKAAEKWATFMGNPMLHLLVQDLINRNKLKSAYGVIKKNDLQKEFPDVYQKCKRGTLVTPMLYFSSLNSNFHVLLIFFYVSIGLKAYE